MPRRRPQPQLAWALAALLALGACVPAPTGRLLITAPSAARLELRLDPARRGLLAASATTGLRVVIDGPDLEEPVTATATAETDRLVVENVPAGPRRVIRLEGLDGAGAVVPGATAYVLAALTAGSNTLTLTATASAAGDVAGRLLAKDREAETDWLSEVEPAALEAAIARMVRELNMRAPALLDAAAVARAIAASSGALPAPSSAFVRQAARLIVRPSNLAPGVTYRAMLTDPVSQPAGVAEAAAAVIEPVAPGEWTLMLVPDAPGVPTYKQAVSLAPGQTREVTVDLAGTPALVGVPIPFSPSGSAVITASGTPTLFALGGSSYSAAGGPQYFQGVVTFTAAAGWGSGGSMETAVVDAAIAPHGGKLYWFGGHDGASYLPTGGVYTPGGAGAFEAIAELPGGRRLRAASAGAVGGKIHLTGGYGPSGALESVLTYDPALDSWTTEALAPTLPATHGMASAVVDGKWYLIGGLEGQAQYSDGGLSTMDTPQRGVSVFTPGAPASWASRKPMPTPRGQAAAVVVNGKIWVIGGSGTLGRASRAVEVYDPASDSWSVRAPLRVGRAHPAAGLVGGKIIVAGGLDGDDPFDSLALDTAEELTP